MRKKAKVSLVKIILTVCFICLISTSFAQESIPLIEKNDFPALRVYGREIYNDSSLWGYINGGADLYLEYGFVKLMTQNILFQGNLINIEAYLMKDQASAFGIFSASHLHCQDQKQLCRFYCVNSQQVQFAKGKLYYNIFSRKVNPGITDACVDVARVILGRIYTPDFVPDSLLSGGVFASGQNNAKLIKGTLGFQNAFPDWQEKFDGFQNYEAQLIPFDFPEGTFTASRLTFASEADLNRFILSQQLRKLKKQDFGYKDSKYNRFLVRINGTTAYFQESWGNSPEIDAFQDAATEQVKKSISKD